MGDHIVFLDLPKTRVYLRPQEKSDLPFFRKSLNDERIGSFLMRHEPLMEAEEEKWFEELPKNKNSNRACSIVLKDNHRVIGSIGLHNISWIDRTATTGTFIGDPELHGQGLGTEAKMLWLKHCFRTLNMRQIYSAAYAYNEKSIGYSLKCGYREVARFPEFVFRNGAYHDVVHLMVTREMWEPLWKEFEKKHV